VPKAVLLLACSTTVSPRAQQLILRMCALAFGSRADIEPARGRSAEIAAHRPGGFFGTPSPLHRSQPDQGRTALSQTLRELWRALKRAGFTTVENTPCRPGLER